MNSLKRGADSDLENDNIQKRQRLDLEQKINLGAKRDQVIDIIKREFQNEIAKRQDEVHLIQERLLKAQKTLHLLKYVIIKSFYDKKELKITTEESALKSHGNKNSSQSRIHPAVKKLLGKRPADHVTYDFARTRGQAQNIESIFLPSGEKEYIEKNYSEELNTISALQYDVASTTLPCTITSNEETKIPIRNKQKIKHEVVIGNISKYSPSNNSQDTSTHKWMVYVRGPRSNPDINHFVKKVRFFLHPSYQPNDIIDLEEPPFHLSRRGWGEFPLRIQIFFQNSSNKSVDVIHNIKLDQNKTGRQTLGNETLINVWLHDEENGINSKSEEEMKLESIIKVESTDRTDFDGINSINLYKIKQELKDEQEDTIFDKKSQEEPRPCSSKYEETFEPQPCSSKDNFDILSISNSESDNIENDEYEDIDFPRSKSAYYDEDNDYDYCLVHLVDHCYTEVKIDPAILDRLYTAESKIIDRKKYKLIIPVNKFSSIRQIVYFLLKKLPLVTNLAHNINYKYWFPYVAETVEQFSNWSNPKRCCQEWYRAKTIKRLLEKHGIPGHEEWSTKFILMFGRAFLFTPLPNYNLFETKYEAGKTLPHNETENYFRSTLTEYIPISTLMEKNIKIVRKEEEDLVDIENIIDEPKVKTRLEPKPKSTETDPNLLPICNYIKRSAAQLKINLEDEEIEPGVFHNSSERVLLQSVTCLIEELIRTAWANKVIDRKGSNLNCRIEKHDIFKVILERPEFDIFTDEGLGKIVG